MQDFETDPIGKLEELRARGASFYVAVNTLSGGGGLAGMQADKLYDGSEFSQYVVKTYRILERREGFVILDLAARSQP